MVVSPPTENNLTKTQLKAQTCRNLWLGVMVSTMSMFQKTEKAFKEEKQRFIKEKRKNGERNTRKISERDAKIQLRGRQRWKCKS